jgi:uncharacterized integral membrane protein
MRQINFLIIFAMCLALVLFSLENTEPAVIRLVKDVQFQAPIAIELILAMGLGAILAWLFSIWNRWQQQLEFFKSRRQIRSKEEQIKKLEQDVERYKVEVEQLKLPALPACEPLKELSAPEPLKELSAPKPLKELPACEHLTQEVTG